LDAAEPKSLNKKQLVEEETPSITKRIKKKEIWGLWTVT